MFTVVSRNIEEELGLHYNLENYTTETDHDENDRLVYLVNGVAFNCDDTKFLQILNGVDEVIGNAQYCVLLEIHLYAGEHVTIDTAERRISLANEANEVDTKKTVAVRLDPKNPKFSFKGVHFDGESPEYNFTIESSDIKLFENLRHN